MSTRTTAEATAWAAAWVRRLKVIQEEIEQFLPTVAADGLADGLVAAGVRPGLANQYAGAMARHRRSAVGNLSDAVRDLDAVITELQDAQGRAGRVMPLR